MKCRFPLGGFALGVLLLGSSFTALAATHTLTIHTNGAGIVNRNPTNSVYPQGSVVTLTAVASNQWMFTSWSGDASGSANPINVTMDANKVITANFAPLPQYTLTVSVSGQGSVDPPGGAFPSNSVVSLTATASNRWIFSRWTGDVAGSFNPISVTMNSNKSVTAVFVQPPTITSHPQSASVGTGDTVTFMVGATGEPPLSYSWRFNEAVLTGATNATLTISNVQSVNAGNYQAFITNAWGSATSQIATLTVTNACTGSNVVATCDEAGLRQAIARGGTVRLCCNGTITLTNTIQITNDVTLDGENQAVVISGNNAVRLFQVATNVTFELKGITLANGRHQGTNGADAGPVAGQPAQPGEDGAGGAIHNQGGTVRLMSCVLSNNSAAAGNAGQANPWNSTAAAAGTGQGGAVFNQNGKVFFENVVAVNNSIVGGFTSAFPGTNGPALGGALASGGGSVYITNSSFNGNVVTGRFGAYTSGRARGGAIYTENAFTIVHRGSFAQNVVISDSDPFRPGNRAFVFGGALYFHSSTAIVERSEFLMNTVLGAGPPRNSPSLFGVAQGGAIYHDGVLHLRDSSVSSNQVMFRDGSGADLAIGGGLVSAGTTYVSGTTFDNNFAKGSFGLRSSPGGSAQGGGIFNSGTLSATNCTLALNRAEAGGNAAGAPLHGGTAAGGGVINAGGTFRLMNVTIASNLVVEGNGSPPSQGANVANSTNGVFSLRNSLIAFGLLVSNGVSLVYSNASGTVTDDGFNISSDGSCNFSSGSSFNFTDPKLDGLADNSGPTLTMALLPDSPAIDFGTSVGAPSTDQRGFRRPSGAGVDIGAFEAGAPTSELELAATRNGSMLNISFTAEAGRTYELQRSTDLTSWQMQEVISASSSGSVSRNIPMAESHSFFRVKTQ